MGKLELKGEWLTLKIHQGLILNAGEGWMMSQRASAFRTVLKMEAVGWGDKQTSSGFRRTVG